MARLSLGLFSNPDAFLFNGDSMKSVAALALGLALINLSQTVLAQEPVVATDVPWSGYWWPIKQGWMWGESQPSTDCSNLSSDYRLGPLNKYDTLLNTTAAEWERQEKGSNSAECWEGYCHAWAAASIMEPEPTGLRIVNAGDKEVQFSVGDQKALLTVCYDVAPIDRWGERWNSDGYDATDISPDKLLELLDYHIRSNNTPFVLDIEPDSEVWNHPVYAYAVATERVGEDDDLHVGRMQLLVADDAVTPDHQGTKPKLVDLFFACRITPDGVVAGSGRWLEESEASHPDFAWMPLDVGIANPHVDYDAVRKIVFSEATRGQARGPATVVQERDGRLELSRGSEPPLIPVSAVGLAMLLRGPSKSAELKLALDATQGAPALGKSFTCSVTSEKPGYLYLFSVDGTGSVRVLFPQDDQDNSVEPGKSVTVPEVNWAAPAGRKRIVAVVSSQPLSLGRLEPAEAGNPNAGRLLHWSPSERAAVSKLISQITATRGSKSHLPSTVELVGDASVAEIALEVKAAEN
jgi:hypothetical protein